MKTLSQNTGSKLTQYLTKFKQKSKNYTELIKESIQKNNLYRHASMQMFNRQKFVDKQKKKKQKSLKALKDQVRQKIAYDIQSQIKVKKLQENNQKQKYQIQKRLSQVQKRNLIRMKEVEDFEKLTIKKISEEINKNTIKQMKLRAQYQKISQQEKRLKEKKILQMKYQKDEWIKIVQQKIILQSLMSDHRLKQQKIIKQKNPLQLAKIQEQDLISEQKKSKNKQSLSKNRMKGNLKQIGRQYLDFAKKMRTAPLSKQARMKNQNYLNINLKVANFGLQIMDKISNNCNNLSNDPTELMTNIQNSIQPITFQKSQNQQLSNKVEDIDKEELQNQFIVMEEQFIAVEEQGIKLKSEK